MTFPAHAFHLGPKYSTGSHWSEKPLAGRGKTFGAPLATKPLAGQQ
ncbi:hypothetical protein [Pseudotabrizicola sp.]|nr:hypothetical protein [Pseudotabrizicola sp.]MDO8883575.1 hypothetical protein [Pseudotabrizicola sp.]